MTEELLKKIEFEKFALLLKEMLANGYGEINYRVVIRDKKIELVALSKMNTYKPETDIINK